MIAFAGMEATAEKPAAAARSRPKSKRVHPVRAYRTAQGMTQMQLAAAIGVTQQDVCRWETCISNPGVRTMAKLAKALKRDAAALLREIVAFQPD